MARWPLGDDVTLSQTITGSPDEVTLTVHPPDGEALQYTPAQVGETDVWAQLVPAADLGQVGRYTAVWTVTVGSDTDVTVDGFDVHDAGQAALISLADAKEHLNIPPMDTSSDAELRLFIDAATQVIDRLAGPVVPREVSEVTASTGRALILATPPVLQVTSMTPLAGGGAYDVSALYVHSPGAGIVRRRDRGLITGGPWTVTYRAGRAEVPPHVALATRILVAHLWETQRTQAFTAPRMDTDTTGQIPGLWFAVPNKVRELLEAETVPVVGY